MNEKFDFFNIIIYVMIALAVLAAFCFGMDQNWVAMIWAINTGIWVYCTSQWKKCAELWETYSHLLEKEINKLRENPDQENQKK